MNKIQIGNIFVDTHTQLTALAQIAEMVYSGKGGSVFTPNVDHVIMADSNSEFAGAYARASMTLADGMPIVWASKILGSHIPERVSGADLLLPLLAMCERSNFKVYLLGTSDQIAKRAMKRAKREFPHIKIVGHSSPMVSGEVTENEVSAIMHEIVQAKPDIVIVALGAPKQEIFIDRARKFLPKAVMLGLGASLDFLAGNISRAPKFMQQNGMEWLYRLYQEPTRMWKRYLRDMKFPITVAKQYIRN